MRDGDERPFFPRSEDLLQDDQWTNPYPVDSINWGIPKSAEDWYADREFQGNIALLQARRAANAKASPRQIAERLAEIFHRDDVLQHEHAVSVLEQEFGGRFLTTNEQGNPAIEKRVLDAFRVITPTAVWSRSQRFWRIREDGDGPSRMVY